MNTITVQDWQGKDVEMTQEEFVKRWHDHAMQLHGLHGNHDDYRKVCEIIEQVDAIAAHEFDRLWNVANKRRIEKLRAEKRAKQEAAMASLDEQRICAALNHIWDIIGGDILNAVAENGERGGNADGSVDRDTVIEVVLDADRVRHHGGLTEAELEAWDTLTYEQHQEFGRKAFTFASYGW